MLPVAPMNHRRARLSATIFSLMLVAIAAPAAASPVDVSLAPLLEHGAPFSQLPRMLALSVGNERITIVASTTLRAYDLAAYGNDPLVRGVGLIDWPWSSGNNNDGTTITFSPPVSRVAVHAGDFSGDDDGPLTLTAFDCNGGAIGSASSPWNNGQAPPFAWLDVRANEICRVVYRSGGQFGGSTFIDAVRFEPTRQ